MQMQSTSTSDRDILPPNFPSLPLSDFPLNSSSDGHIQLQSTTSNRECELDVRESESLSSSDGLSSTIQGEERSSHPTSHLPQRSLPLTTPICTEHCNIQQEGMFKGS